MGKFVRDQVRVFYLMKYKHQNTEKKKRDDWEIRVREYFLK